MATMSVAADGDDREPAKLYNIPPLIMMMMTN